ncbi:hypothetical protein PHYSODRAFT_258990 [Phytophthora sojae]|uniref:Uncharacterized protein n=1 Tax=Phytophthora sojae (strain P6497) TaxID=1094619 RepID=G4ZXF8_PHYSP|nr:hypothetical protein PHYSODRAFT_258990 [Phytophthora sojae]EGZ11821.1 hypothetical protein PHYSODRAFT_258990 [Phytophthora sojae]|eukprot:XP_009532154.1 hypothetical protein PHYSODRAFT_258990 [Phytophthora sojae]
MARTTGTPGSSKRPPGPEDAHVTRAQRDSAESERSRSRQRQRELRHETDRTLRDLPPLPVYNRGVLEAQRAANVARARRDEQEIRLAMDGRYKRTRSATAMLRSEDGKKAGQKARAEAREKSMYERWEARAVREMFGIEPDSDSDDGALAEAISALDEADEELSPGGTDDSDYEEKTPPFGTDPDASDEDEEDNDDEERESAAENDG